MEFAYFPPSEILRPFIRHYYLFYSTAGARFADTVFPSGDMEMIFNLGDGIWSTRGKNNPPLELWGQFTKPLPIESSGRQTMLGIRFFPHSAAYFLDDDIGSFNDQVSDLTDILGKPIEQLHVKLLGTADTVKRIELIESFLLHQLIQGEKRSFRIEKVGHILKSMAKEATEIKINAVASKHGISSRGLNKLVYRHTGLTPIAFNKIRRFQSSLKLIARNDQPLTAIAYDCGYFDQSHFIKEFRSFTGVTPSAYLKNISPVNQLLQQ
jgi:AraC-like DNA-binding protein